MERGREGRKERALGGRGKVRTERERERRGSNQRQRGRDKKKQIRKGGEPARDRRKVRGKKRKRACLTVSQVHSDAWRQTGE